MNATEDARSAVVQRRRLIVDLTLLAGAASLFDLILPGSWAVAGQVKLAQNEIGYQPTPKGQQRCDACVNWNPPGTCKLVAGSISPTGWCGLFARKS